MAEKMTIAIENPTVEFVVSGITLAEFNYFELEQAINDVGETFDIVKIRQWMIEHGLPETVNLATVDQWLVAYLKANNERLKKASGQ